MNPAKISFGKRVLRRSVLLAEASVLCLASSSALAAIVVSPVSNLPVPQDISGVYINVVTGATGTSGAGTAGWDFNPYNSNGGANLGIYWAPAPAGGVVAMVGGTQYVNLSVGAVVGPTSPVTRAIQGTNPNFLVSGTEILGMSFVNEQTGATNFGYARIATGGPSGFPATIVSITYENTGQPITVAGLDTAPQFAYTPPAGGTVAFTGGGAVGSTANGSISVAVGTAGTGTGAAATTTTTCTAPTAPFTGFGQSVSAVGAGAIAGSPLSGTCTRGVAAVTQTLTCSENRGGTPTAVTFNLSCPAGSVAAVTSNPPSGTPIAFGTISVGGTASRTITFTNTAAVDQTLTCTLTGGPFSGATGTVTVPAGGSITRTINFTSAVIGAFTGNLSCTAGAATFAFGVSGQAIISLTNVPTLGDGGRWLAILLMLGFGLVAVAVRRS